MEFAWKPLSWNLLSKTNLLGTVYTWNELSHNYVSYNGTVGLLTDGIISAEQAFFVQATTASPAITIPGSARLHSGNAFFKSNVQDVLTLKLKGNGVLEDAAFIHFRSDATNGFDQEFDGYKLFGSADAPQLYSITTTDNLTINSLPDIASNPVVAMGFKVGVDGTYTLSASTIESFTNLSGIYLEDLQLNKIQDLTKNPVYTFAATTGDNAHRFNVHFAPVGMSENKSSDVKIFSRDHSVLVNIPTEMKGNIIVYNMLGTELSQQTIQSGLNTITLNVPTGIYLVKVDGDSGTTTGKVFIK